VVNEMKRKNKVESERFLVKRSEKFLVRHRKALANLKHERAHDKAKSRLRMMSVLKKEI